MSDYYPRIADKLLSDSIDSSGAVLIEGPKWCGKTRTAKQLAKSVLNMQGPDERESNLQAASIKPSLLLQGDTPRLIDEWQVAPILWDAVRHEVDKRGEDGQFILTGSATPVLDDQISHTGTGRISRIRMRPMSLFESKDSTGEISLRSLFNNKNDISTVSRLDVEELAQIIVRGGWPASVTSKPSTWERRALNYVDSVVNFDVSRVDGVEKDPSKMFALIRSLARNTATEASYASILRDMEGGESESITRPTINSYLNALNRLFVVEDLPAWNPSIRSATKLRKSPKRNFVDPSIATAALGVNQESLLNDFNTFGFMFESLCIRDLRVYADALDGKVYHYRDKNGLECDAVIVLRDGRWGAVEIKLGSFEFDKAAANLKSLEMLVDTQKMKKPAFLMILTGTKYGYVREDGIIVMPIGSLKD